MLIIIIYYNVIFLKMEIKKIKKIATFLKYEVRLEISGKIIDYEVNSAHWEDGKEYVQNYSKKQFGIRLTPSQNKKIREYFMSKFLNGIDNKCTYYGNNEGFVHACLFAGGVCKKCIYFKMQKPQVKNSGFVPISSHGGTEF